MRRERTDALRLPPEAHERETAVVERDEDVPCAHLGDRVECHEEVVVVLELLADELLGLPLVRRDEERGGLDAEAQWLAGPSALAILQLRSGKLGPLPTPEMAEAYEYSPAEAAVVAEATESHLVGDPDTVVRGLGELQQRTNADEIMLSTRAHSYDARARSLELVAERWPTEAAAVTTP